jgi:hypothetical protein
MPYNQASPTGYGAGFGTNDPREAITQALMNVQYPPPAMAAPQSQAYGAPQGPQMPIGPMAGIGPGMPPAAQPQGFAGMQSQGVVAGAPQPAMPQAAMPQPMQGARGIGY